MHTVGKSAVHFLYARRSLWGLFLAVSGGVLIFCLFCFSRLRELLQLKKMLVCLLCQFTHDIRITCQKNNSISGREALPRAVAAVGTITQLFAWVIKNVLSN